MCIYIYMHCQENIKCKDGCRDLTEFIIIVKQAVLLAKFWDAQYSITDCVTLYVEPRAYFGKLYVSQQDCSFSQINI